MTQRRIHSLIFAGKIFVVILSLSGMCLLHDCNWLVDVKGRLSYLVDFDKSETENEELEMEMEIDEFIKNRNNPLDNQIAFGEKEITFHPNIPVSLYLDITTPPPEVVTNLLFYQ